MAQQVNNARQEKLDAQTSALDAERKAREAQEQLVQTQLQANIELERMVEQRTMELTSALERVEDMNQQLEKLSITDALTGAYNHRYFDEQLAEQHRDLMLALTASIGIAQLSQSNSQTAQSLIQEADTALYQAEGRNRTKFSASARQAQS